MTATNTAPPGTPGRFRAAWDHWLCAKWEPGKQTEGVKPPEGMSWFVLPPRTDIESDEIQWFPTGKKAIRYLMAKKDYKDLVLNPIAQQLKSRGEVKEGA
ncbi:hypothetical protein SSEA_SKINNY_12 [Mycobacterium phage Skinny]|uniref:Uncharacterized protein n=2 Tax=Bongovirus bongo TaxID=1983750 RepID=A0A0M4S3Y7_9CAUD|nr:hypothetical protein PEGLEG_11 [Mycobacterium phage PegLeg]AGM12262.1 hypothetical protein PEGLEG_11 [Mycobacterium phage PegLeg]ALF00539.1 hypothetical protein SEA_BRICOLE_11 [Mycobacterium phage Bricole]QUU29212.1 hypothetical protein [Mycobacterium phage SirSheldon]UXE05220.1 hypothetical protein SSEA_SKINNY_12 [Mycobacterium phage Skinny]